MPAPWGVFPFFALDGVFLGVIREELAKGECRQEVAGAVLGLLRVGDNQLEAAQPLCYAEVAVLVAPRLPAPVSPALQVTLSELLSYVPAFGPPVTTTLITLAPEPLTLGGKPLPVVGVDAPV